MSLASVRGQEVDQLKRSLARPQSDSVQALTFIELGRTYIQLNLDSSWHYLNKAIQLSQKLPDKRLLMKAYNVLATTYVVTGEHTKGLAILRKAEQLSRHYPFDSIQLELQSRLTQVYRIQGDYKQALRTGLALETYINKHPDLQTSSLLTLYSELALIYDHQHNDSLALPYYLKANDFAVSHKKIKPMIGTLGNLGEYYIVRKDFTKAEYYIRKSLAISRQYQFNHSTAECLRNLGEINREQRRYKAAIAYYQQALAIQQQIGAQEFVGNIYVQLAQSYGGLSDYSTALAYIHKSVSVFQAIQSPRYLHKALVIEATLQEKSGHVNEALRLTRQAQVLQDSLTGLDKQKAIAQIQASVDLERKQNQITNLKHDLALQQHAQKTTELQLMLSQRQQTFYGVVSFLLLLIALISYYNFDKQKKAQRLLSQQQKAILQQTDQLIELNQTKDQLFSIISHDLRSPLVGLKQDVQQMRQNIAQNAPPDLTWLDRIEHRTDTLLALVTTLLDWAHIQVKGFTIRLQTIDLSEQVAQTVSYFSDRLHRKQITLINQTSTSTAVVADSQLLAIVMRNLIDNAVKFTPIGGYIRILAVEHENTVALQIRDTGIGMTDDMLEHLFTKPDVRRGTYNEPGTGLGMQISRELLEKQHGELTVKSQPDNGTTVTITLTKPSSPAGFPVENVSKSPVEQMK